jgi:hypothetical protein
VIALGAALALSSSVFTAGLASAVCGDTWTVSEDGSFSAGWRDVAIGDASHAWAVGDDGNNHLGIWAWNGSGWSDDTPSFLSATTGSLFAVWANGPDDVWAVGHVYDDGLGTEQALVLHRTAGGWQMDATFGAIRRLGFLDVWGDGNGELWAIGSAIARGRIVGATYRHVGGDWVRVRFPTPDGVQRFLSGVSGTGADDVWVVGADQKASARMQPIAFHWTGAGWTRSPIPPTPRHDSTSAAFSGVAAADATHVWAVGTFANTHRMLVERWNGTTWERVPIANHDGPEGLSDVDAASPTDAVAVGSRDGRPVIRRWDGIAWSPVKVPWARGSLRAVDVATGVGAFAAGSHDFHSAIAATCG